MPRPFTIPQVPYYELLAGQAEDRPNQPALIAGQWTVTYRELWEASGRLAAALAGRGVVKGDRVAVAMYNRPEWAMAFYACSRLGAIVTPVNPSHKAGEIRNQLADAGARAAMVDGHVLPSLLGIRSELPHLRLVVGTEGDGEGVIPFQALLKEGSGQPAREVDFVPEIDLMALPYSSGTTGPPKGVMLTHANLVATHLQYVRSGHVRDDDISLVFLPLAHVYGMLLLGGGLAAGVTIVLTERFRPEEALRLAQRHRVTLFYAIPTVVQELADYPDLERYDLSSIRYINSGGGPLPREAAERLETRTGIRVVGGYGLTEAPISGPLVPGEERRIVDLETGRHELPPGEVGELVIRGPHVMKGYWQNEAATREVLRNGWLYTGDIGYVDKKGRVRILDRKKEMIKYKGFAVAPAELEGALLRHPAVADCAVVGHPDRSAGEIPKAFVVLRNGAKATPEDLMEFVTGEVAGYKRIREVAFVEEIPRNPYGKILKDRLRARGVEGDVR